MIMLQRAAEGGAWVDCEDEMVQLACAMESDECPAACREDASDNGDEETNTVVKSGSLEVTANATSSRSAVKGAASDLDTLIFKTSEEVEITKVVLERYGYSSTDDVENVRLENSDGTIVAEAKSLNSRDQVTLSIKKDYRKADGREDWTVVVELKNAASGSTIGFKVVDVTSTAKNVDLGNYKPYTYDIVTYDAAKISLDDKGSEKDYNYEDGESYEVAKLKVKAGTSALEVNGFNLTNVYQWEKLDLEDFISDVTVEVAGKELKGVSYTIDDDELNVTFNSYEIAAKENATFSINVTLKDFDEYGQGVEFVVKASSDAKITEKKTWARVSVTLPHAADANDVAIAAKWSDAHQFVGSKIKLTSNKLGSVDAAQGSDDVVVLDWEIEIAESLDKLTFVVTGTYEGLATGYNKNPIDEMTLVVGNDEYTASPSYSKVSNATGGVATFTFSNVEIDKSGKFQILIDVEDDATQSATIKLEPTINKNVLSWARYSDAREYVKGSEVKGSISFATKITIQPSKASLENNISKRVEFVREETSRKTVFDGTYTAKKGDVYLNTVLISWDAKDDDITFYVFIDGDEIATLDPQEEDTFSDILVEAGKSVKVKVEAEVYPTSSFNRNYTLELRGEDENGNDNSGKASDQLVEMKAVNKWTINITNEKTSKNTVLLKATNSTIAEFTVKPSNNNEWLTLEDIVLTGSVSGQVLTFDNIRLKVDGVEYDGEPFWTTGIVYDINEELPTNGYTVEIILKKEKSWTAEVSILSINESKQNKTYTKAFADALVYISAQSDEGDYTQYYLWVDLYDDAYTVSGVQLFTNTNCTSGALNLDGLDLTDVSDGDDFTIDNGDTTQTIRCIKYEVIDEKNVSHPYKFNNSDYADYFKVGGSARRVYSNNN